MKRATVPILLTGLALAACGGSDSSSGPRTAGSDEDQIRAVAKDFYAAYDDRDFGKICDLLSPKAKAQIDKAATYVGGKAGDCPGTFEKAVAAAGDSTSKLTLKTVEITGDKAVAPDGSLENGKPTDLTFEKVDGKWYAGADPEESE